MCVWKRVFLYFCTRVVQFDRDTHQKFMIETEIVTIIDGGPHKVFST